MHKYEAQLTMAKYSSGFFPFPESKLRNLSITEYLIAGLSLKIFVQQE